MKSIIAGESGAGKTEATKQILNFLTAASEKCANSNSANKSNLKAVILQSNPLTEAFGNARTGRNDNSSRFGKLISLSFGKSGVIEDGSLTHYMLVSEKACICHVSPNLCFWKEKSRVVGQEDSERNYHAFHYLLADSALAKKYHLKPLSEAAYTYINTEGSGVKNINGLTIEQMNAILSAACCDIGITAYELDQMYSVLASILFLGNLEYAVNEQAEAAGHEAVVIKAESLRLIETASKYLGLDSDLLTKVVTSHTLSTNSKGSIVSISHNEEAARNTVSTLCKALYCQMFDWCIMKVNLALHGCGIAESYTAETSPVVDDWLQEQEQNGSRMVHILVRGQ
jgi:myosin heavy subunit